MQKIDANAAFYWLIIERQNVSNLCIDRPQNLKVSKRVLKVINILDASGKKDFLE